MIAAVAGSGALLRAGLRGERDRRCGRLARGERLVALRVSFWARRLVACSRYVFGCVLSMVNRCACDPSVAKHATRVCGTHSVVFSTAFEEGVAVRH